MVNCVKCGKEIVFLEGGELVQDSVICTDCHAKRAEFTRQRDFDAEATPIQQEVTKGALLVFSIIFLIASIGFAFLGFYMIYAYGKGSRDIAEQIASGDAYNSIIMGI